MANFWDASISSTDIAISADKLTASRTHVTGSGNYATALSTPAGNGNVYAEVTITIQGSTDAYVGIANTNIPINPGTSYLPGYSPDSISWLDNGYVYHNSVNLGQITAFLTGDVVAVAVNGSSQTVQFRNVTQNTAWSAAFDISSISPPYHLLFSCWYVNESGKANFDGPFLGTLPPGYTGWSPAAPASQGWGQKAYYTTYNVFGAPGDPAPGAWAVQTFYNTHSPTSLT